jgi:hypothetical protein
VIARAICALLGVSDENVIKGAFVHDLDEIRTGDIPTPFKEEVRNQGFELNDVYERVTDRTLSFMEQRIIKVSDLIEAHWFISEFGVGRMGEQVEHDMRYRVSGFIDEWEIIDRQTGLKVRKFWSEIMNGEYSI